MATGFNVTGLAAYVDQNSKEILALQTIGAKSKKLARVITGVKGSKNIHLMSKNLTYQSDTCKLTADGSAVLTEKTLTVGKIGIVEEYCMKDLLGKWTELTLKAGSNGELGEAELFQMIVDQLTLQVVAQEAVNVWQGDTGGAGNLTKYDGWLKLIDAAITAGTITSGAFVIGKTYTIVTPGTTNFTLIGAADSLAGTTFVASGVGIGTGTALDVIVSPINGNPTRIATATGIVAANVITIFQGIYNLIPSTILRNKTIFIACGDEVFRILQMALLNANNFHFNGDATDMELVLPATNIRVIADEGLIGTNRIVASYWDNMIVGTDLESDEDEVTVYVDPRPSNAVIEIATRFKAGTQIGFVQELVQFKLV